MSRWSPAVYGWHDLTPQHNTFPVMFNIIFFSFSFDKLERFSIECRKTKTKVIPTAN